MVEPRDPCGETCRDCGSRSRVRRVSGPEPGEGTVLPGVCGGVIPVERGVDSLTRKFETEVFLTLFGVHRRGLSPFLDADASFVLLEKIVIKILPNKISSFIPELTLGPSDLETQPLV